MLIATVAATIGVMIAVWPVGADYYHTYQKVSTGWLRGETKLYDSQSHGFYNAPWALLLTVPLSLLPMRVANGLLNAISLLAMLAAVHLVLESRHAPVYALFLPLATPHTFDLLIRGQIDAFVLLGVAVGWFAIANRQPLTLSMALWLMSIKPQNVLLVIVLFLWAIRYWSLKDWIMISSLPLVSFLAANRILGFDWPLRYWSNLRGHPPLSYAVTTVWRGASKSGMPGWPLIVCSLAAMTGLTALAREEGLTTRTLSIALATNLLFTPYALGYHYVLLIPAMLYLTIKDWKVALLPYLVTWSPFLRLRWGFDIAWVDAAYPAILLVAHWFPFVQGVLGRETPGGAEG